MPNQSGRIVFLLILLVISLGLTSFYFYSERNTLEEPSFFVSQELNTQVLECNKESEDLEGEVWAYLPKELRELTYRKDIVPSGEATYEISLLKASKDCRFRGVLVELVGRGAGAYTEKDFNKRGIYIYDIDEKVLVKILKMPRNSYIETKAGFDIWNDDKYEFVLREDSQQGKLLETNYSYDLKKGSLKKTPK